MLKNKTILIMGIRNKWSIAFGIAKSAYENGAKLIFTYMGEENKEKIEEILTNKTNIVEMDEWLGGIDGERQEK